MIFILKILPIQYFRLTEIENYNFQTNNTKSALNSGLWKDCVLLNSTYFAYFSWFERIAIISKGFLNVK